ncbi:MAG: fasciclin domain-containing protein [Prevotella sp.]|nr:fasciclin domain-containing protein [Prevotella sp.]
MKTKRQIGKPWQRLALAAAGVLLAGGSALTSCTQYDLDEKTPEGWGSSIYSWLDEQGKFTNTVRLIDDLGYRDVLAKTGSKTLFVADDEAYDRFYRNNEWGVKSYEGLSTAQKKMLLFGSMIDNSYQVQALSSTEGPVEGNCMRRASSLSIYDTVPVLQQKNIPDAPYWQLYRDRDNLVVMHDMTPTPMIHFIERHMANKQITNDDYDFLYNYTTHRQSGDASVNGAQIVEQNIRCLNGFINRMSEVVTPLPNMADIIAKKPNTQLYAHLLNRYSVLDYCGDEVTRAYNVSRGTQVDSVFQLRYFAKRSQGGQEFTLTHNQKSQANGELPFDPGWNSYYILSNETSETALQQDMAVMLVPSDEALTEYWENGAGAALRKSFGSWDNVPYSTLSEFLKANMLSSFISSVPSKFQFILNDAADPMGITKEHVDSVWLACNGAVYLTNHVFTPTSFVSVMYPTVVDQNMSIIHWAIEQLNYGAYLNSLNSRYSFFLPSNGALLEYVDPVSYGKPQRQLLRFHYDPNKKGSEVYASIHNIDSETGLAGDSIGALNNIGGKSLDNNPILNRLYNILDDHVVIGDVEDGHEYYRTKGGSTLRVQHTERGAEGMVVEGSRQVNGETPSVPISYIYDQTNGGNGKTYILEQGPVLGTSYTVFNLLGKHPEFSRFRELLEGSELLETIHDGRFACSDTCVSVFNNFHYTVYVPTNESIDALIADGTLPTWDDVAVIDTTNSTGKAQYLDYTQRINDFLRYHIQDNALYIGADNTTGTDNRNEDGSSTSDFETACIDRDSKVFYKLSITTDNGGHSIAIKDRAGNTRHVLTDRSGLYNVMAREYVYQNADKSTANIIHSSSSAVIHLIDGPLMIEK